MKTFFLWFWLFNIYKSTQLSTPHIVTFVVQMLRMMVWKKLLLKGVAPLKHCREPVNWLEAKTRAQKNFFKISDPRKYRTFT